MKKIHNWLFAHCNEVNETYWQHARHALYFCALMFAAAVFAFLHAVLPFVFKNTSTNLLARVIAKIESTDRSASAFRGSR